MKAFGYVFGDGTGGDDGNGVVGGAKIGYTHQCGYTEFRTPLACDVAGEAGDDKVDTAVVADCLQHSACQQGDDDKFAHTGDTRSHSAEPIEESGACIHVFGRSDAEDAHCRANADDSRRDDAK